MLLSTFHAVARIDEAGWLNIAKDRETRLFVDPLLIFLDSDSRTDGEMT